ncbi:hypothetical protein R1sor_013887 [Riccia sorocarpa]|uniref:DUF4283 domain-containing protein n=1 Tax=Riccia sorocarpa TaxID=122646 RepID=A0ABD3H8F4_9MARC
MVFPLPWDTRFTTKDLKFIAVHVWLELNDVHPGLMRFGLNMLRNISPIIYAAKNTETQRINVVRGCVLIDLNKALPEYIPIAACPLAAGRRTNQTLGTEEGQGRQGNPGEPNARAPAEADSQGEGDPTGSGVNPSAPNEVTDDFTRVMQGDQKPKFQTPEIKKSMKVNNRYGILEPADEEQVGNTTGIGNQDVRSRKVESPDQVAQGRGGASVSSSSPVSAENSKSADKSRSVLIREIIDSSKQNVTKGDLRERTIRHRVRNNYKHIDILMLQELKSHEYELENSLRLIAEGDKVTVDYSQNSWGSTTIIVKLTVKVLEVGIKGDGQATWALLETRKGRVGVMSIYTPHSEEKRAVFWRWVRDKIGEENWII